MKKTLLSLLSIFPFAVFSQNLTGTILNGNSNEPIIGAEISTSEGSSSFSGESGKFALEIKEFPVMLYFSEDDFSSDSTRVHRPGDIWMNLTPKSTNSLETVVVTASRRGQKQEEVAISMDVLKPELIHNRGTAKIEDAVSQSPGVYTMDGQVSIRGGSGFSYGAGSRVMVLWNDIPMISPDAGDVKWNTIPMELTSGIEVIKGASSVLYGSGALNGIIAISEIVPTETPYNKARLQFGVYDKPRRLSLQRGDVLTNQLIEFAHGRKIGNFYYNVGVDLYKDDGYREGEIENRAHIAGKFAYNIPKVRGLQVGVGYNLFMHRLGSFLIWESDSLAYTPMGGANISDSASTLSLLNGYRISIDPYVKYMGPNGWKHHLKTRFYSVNNSSISDTSQSSLGISYYMDYMAQKDFGKNFILSTGATYTRTQVQAALYGNHHSDNAAAYAQLEKKWGRFTLTGGVRFEFFKQDNVPIDSYLYFNKDSTARMPVYPIARIAAAYQVADGTFLRASFGQGVRYPATSERFVATSAGALNIFPNPDLKKEEGYAVELGLKQVFMTEDGNWKGILDFAGFYNRYNNMTEFTFGVYNPEGTILSGDPNSPWYIMKWIGFRAENSDDAQIFGGEFSFASEGKIGEVTFRSLLGYTYMDSQTMNKDSMYLVGFSDTTSKMLKYRFKHLAKADVEVEYKGISLGIAARYNSFMKNIDRIFEEEIVPGTYILNGLKDYRAKHNKGDVVFDMRIAYQFNKHYRLGFIVNNLFNREYMGRPGDIKAPRSFIAQLQLNF